MPIPVTCDCGKSLNIPDQYAGQKVKCPRLLLPRRGPQLGSSPGPSISVEEGPRWARG